MSSSLQAQLSQEEEVLTRDFCNLSKKNIYGEHDLSCFLDKYMDLIHRMDIEEACEYINLNFAKAAVILENSTKLYCNKVDRLGNLIEALFDALKQRIENHKRNRAEGGDVGNNETIEDIPDQEINGNRRKRRRIKGDLAEEDFIEVDNMSGLSGKDMNESSEAENSQITFLEQAINILAKTHKERKRADVIMNKADHKDDSKLRDWIFRADMMIMREVFLSEGVHDPLRYVTLEDDVSIDETVSDSMGCGSGPHMPDNSVSEPNNNNQGDNIGDSTRSDSPPSDNYEVAANFCDDIGFAILRDDCDVFEKLLRSKELKPGPTQRVFCPLCDKKKTHKKKGKRCVADYLLDVLESYLHPMAQPVMSDLQYGVLPDAELYGLYKSQMKLTAHLLRSRPQSLKIPPDGKVDKFQGFDEDEDFRNEDDGTSDILEGDCATDMPELDFPLPSINGLLPPVDIPGPPLSPNAPLTEPQIIAPENNSPEDAIERNKQLGVKIAAWHESLSDKLALSQKRGALDVDQLASRVMKSFKDENPKQTFQELVLGEELADVPRFFFACLQLANEGNVNIEKTGKRLERDCFSIVRLRKKRVRELEEYDPDSRSPGKRIRPSGKDHSRNRDEQSGCEDESDGNYMQPVKERSKKRPLNQKGRSNSKKRLI